MKVVVDAGKVLAEKKDVESACKCHRKSGSSRSLCELVVNVLLFIVALIFIGLGAYSWNQIVFGKPQPVMLSSVYTSTNITSTYYGVPQEPFPPGSLVPIFPASAPPSFEDAMSSQPTVNPSELLDWPEVFQREGWMLVYKGCGSVERCRFPEASNTSRNCLLNCYKLIDLESFPADIRVEFQRSDQNNCLASFATTNATVASSWSPKMAETLMKEFQSLPPAPPSKNFTVWPYVKLFPLTVVRPILAVRIPLLDMLYTDHTKICLSFCALHPSCYACTAFPEEPMYVDQIRDRAVGPVGYNGTLSCWLFSEGPTRPTKNDTSTFTLFPSLNSMTYLSVNQKHTLPTEAKLNQTVL